MPSSPITPGRTTNSASPEDCSSALTMSTYGGGAIGTFALLERLRLLERFVVPTM
jgi:hypothetical protein